VDLAVRRRNAFSPYVWDTLEVLHLEHKDELHERGMIHERRVDVTDDHTTAQHCYDTFDYIESLPLHLRV
jgi:hypothetical protein